MSFFDKIELLPDDPILGLNDAFNAERNPNKVNLGIGTYKDSNGRPLVLSTVKKAEQWLLQQHFDKEYLPISGEPNFDKEIIKLIYGEHSEVVKSELIFASQTIGGTGALRVGGDFFVKQKHNTIYLPDPTWPNHIALFQKAGMNIKYYPYYNTKDSTVDFKGMCGTLQQCEPGDVILMHACCHNPTGTDLTMEQWKELAAIFKKKKLIPFFDLAYLGFANDIETDVQPIRHFSEEGLELFVASSCSKNFGLYCERVGALTVVTHSKEIATAIGSHMKSLIRGNYSNPPAHGARIVAAILSNKEWHNEWIKELTGMRNRIQEMRMAFAKKLMEKCKTKDFSFILKQHGLFSFCGLTQEQVMKLRKEKGIYMPSNGRMNVAGLNWHNVDYTVDAVLNVIGSKPQGHS